MDTPTIEEAFEQASEDLTSKDEGSQVETPDQKPEVKEDQKQPEEETTDDTSESPEKDEKEANEEPKGEDTKEDKEADFLKVEGDVKKMTPEELLETQKNWHRAYTQKRQAEVAELKQLQAERAELQAKLKSMTQAPQATQKPFNQMTPQEYATYVAEMAKEEVNVAKENSYIEAQEKAFYNVDQRLQENGPNYDADLHDLVMMRLTQAREQHEAEGKPITEFSFVEHANKFIKAFDERSKSIKQNFLKKQSQIARTKSQDFAKTSPKTSGAKAKKKNMDLEESISAAFEER